VEIILHFHCHKAMNAHSVVNVTKNGWMSLTDHREGTWTGSGRNTKVFNTVPLYDRTSALKDVSVYTGTIFNCSVTCKWLH